MTAEIITLARPIPARRLSPLPLTLGTRVYARPGNDHPAEGVVLGVVRAGSPVYDVRADDGRWLAGLAADQVEEIA